MILSVSNATCYGCCISGRRERDLVAMKMRVRSLFRRIDLCADPSVCLGCQLSVFEIQHHMGFST